MPQICEAISKASTVDCEMILASDMTHAMDPDEADESFIEVIDLCTDKPRVLVKKENLGSEKQILVDPISLREASSSQQLVMYPISRPPPKTKFLSQSLPNSAFSSPSPAFGSNTSMKKWEHQTQSSSLSIMYRQDSIELANDAEGLHEIHLLRSKSCGEGRVCEPPDAFDLWLTSKFQNAKHEVDNNHHHNTTHNSKIEAQGEDDKRKGEEENGDAFEDKFKCRALCLYLPGFSKVKLVKATRQGSNMSQPKVSETGHVVSKSVSLEKFECDSWIYEDGGEASSSNLFFDLPSELIRCSVNDDTHFPVTTAFVFEEQEPPKPPLTNSNPTSRKKSSESVGHVRFSTSSSPVSFPVSPTACIIAYTSSAPGS